MISYVYLYILMHRYIIMILTARICYISIMDDQQMISYYKSKSGMMY